MKLVLIDENDCVRNSIVSNVFDGGCVFMQDCSVSIEDSEFLDNLGSFILSFSRYGAESRDLSNLVSKNICILSIVELNDVGNGFLYIYNRTNDDYIDVIDGNFGSDSIEYTFYMISELDTSLNNNGDLTHISLDNIGVLNNSEGIGDVGLNLNVTNGLFKPTVMKGLFGSLTSAPTASHNIINRYSSDYIFYYDMEGIELNVWFNRNEWINLDVLFMLTTNGPMSLMFSSMTISDNFDFMHSIDPLFILFDYIDFNNFENVITIVRLNSQMKLDLSESMKVHLQDSNFYNLLTDINNDDGQDRVVLNIYNLLSIDLVMIDECNFLGHSYINMSLGQRNFSANTVAGSGASENDPHYSGDRGLSTNSELNVLITKCFFTGYTSDSALYMTDIDFYELGTGDAKDDIRAVTKIFNTTFNDSRRDAANVITLEFISNNEDDVDCARFTMENSIIEDSNVTDVISFVADQIGYGNYNHSSIILYESPFLNNDARYLINPFIMGIIPTVQSHNFIFENNTVSLAIIKLDYASLNMTSSVINNHLLLFLLEAQNPIHVDIINVQILNTKVIELWNNRSIEFSTINIENSVFWTHLNGSDMYIELKDEINFVQCDFYSLSMYSPVSHGLDGSPADDEQLYFNICEFGYFDDQVGFEMNSNKQAWMVNMTMMNSSIHDNNNNGGLLKFLNANLHVEESSVILFENVNIWNNTDVIKIIEDSNNDNSVLLSRFNLFEMRNVVFYENSRTVLYHSYPNKASYNIDIYSSAFRDNIEASLSSKSSFSGNLISNSSVMIEIIENGSDCTHFVNDGLSMVNTESNAHFYVYEFLFLRNEYSESNIYQYCAISHIIECNMMSNVVIMFDLILVELFLQDSRISLHIDDLFSGSGIVLYAFDMFDVLCDTCLNDDTNSWMDNCVFEDSSGILFLS